MASNTHFFHRLARLLRLIGLLLGGLTTISLRWPGMSDAARRRSVRTWSRKVLRTLGLRVEIVGPDAHTSAQPDRDMRISHSLHQMGEPQAQPHHTSGHIGGHPNNPSGGRGDDLALPARCLLVSNHISWVDILVLLSVCPATFVAKAEIRRWPLVGWLCAGAGTLFIERGSRAAARRINRIVTEAIAAEKLVCIFPEGTTTDGMGVAKFHAALYQPAIDAEAHVQPVLLRYITRSGEYCAAPNYVGETTLWQSVWRTTAPRRMRATLQLLDACDTRGADRRELARRTQASIAEALHRAGAHTRH